MFTVVYRSRASLDFDGQSISSMLSRAQKFNFEENITGCLLYHQGQFVQLIEGDEIAVKSLYHKISNDNRHYDVLVMSREKSEFRIFPDWSMIYNNLNDNTIGHSGEKRKLFDEIYHSSNAVSHPGVSKMALWVEVNKILDSEKQGHYSRQA